MVRDELLFGGLDAARRGLLRHLTRWRFSRAMLGDRELRIGVVAALQVVVAAALALIAPIWLLLVAPLVLGVPHVASDLRYLWLQPRAPWPRPARAVVVTALGVMTGQRIVLAMGGRLPLPAGVSALQLELLLGAVAMAAPLALAATASRRAVGVTAVAAALGLAWWAPRAAITAFAHLHNFVGPGVVVVVALASLRSRRAAGDPHTARAATALGAAAAAFVSVQAAVLSGACDGWLAACGGLYAPASGLDFARLEDQIAPGLSWPWSARVVVCFAIAQAVHYGAWLRWLPQLWSPRLAPTPFAADWRGARCAFGAPLLALVALAALGLPVAAWLTNAAEARLGYLHAIAFHGWLELAALAGLWAAGASLGPAGSDR